MAQIQWKDPWQNKRDKGEKFYSPEEKHNLHIYCYPQSDANAFIVICPTTASMMTISNSD